MSSSCTLLNIFLNLYTVPQICLGTAALFEAAKESISLAYEVMLDSFYSTFYLIDSNIMVSSSFMFLFSFHSTP
jgi:hypothetical protein